LSERTIGAYQRTLRFAHDFVEESRLDLARAAVEGVDIPPRIRAIHDRPGHASPEYRTLAVPIPPGAEGASPTVLSSAIAKYAANRSPSCLLLTLDIVAVNDDDEPQSLFVAEARDHAGTRLFLAQPFTIVAGRIEWAEPVDGGWRDPGEDEMIIDAAFA